MDMPMAAPSHTVSTFYHLLIMEALILLIFVIAGTVIARYWKRHGKEIKAELGLSTEDRAVKWKAQSSEDEADTVMLGHRILVIGLGVMWMIDGLLQAQPALGTNFYQNVIAPVVDGQPAFLVNNFLDISRLAFTSSPLWLDSLTVWIQLFIGIGILFGPQSSIGRFSLRVSVVWGLIVWVFGEALGGILSGGTWLTGAPGSVLFYIFLAALLLAPYSYWKKGTAYEAIAWMFSLTWLISGVLQALPSSGFWNPGGLSDELLPMAQMNQPAWMAKPLYMLAYGVLHGAIFWNGLFVVLPILLAVVWFVKPNTKWGFWLTGVVAFLSWWLCQDFGVIGGAATDPNSGAMLLLILLSIPWLKKSSVTPWERVKTWTRRSNPRK